MSKLEHKFDINGYKNVNLDKILAKSEKEKVEVENSRKIFFQIDFINDSHLTKIKQILKKHNLPVQVAPRPGKNLKNCFRPAKIVTKHPNCEPCNHMPSKFNCDDKFLVYKFTCNLCNDAYIGQSSRPFKTRFQEHKRSITKKDVKSALSEHFLFHHPEHQCSINNFDLEILHKGQSPLEARLLEAKLIDSHQPRLNRKHESAHL